MKPALITVLIVLMGLQFSCKPKTTEPSANNQPKKVSDKGVNIAYSDTGKGDTTLLFVHGWAINRSYWSEQVKHFSNRYRVVTMDLPGFGESGKNRNDWTTRAYGDDVDSVIMQLGLKNVILVGHSMSGDIVLQAAANMPGNILAIVGVDNFKSVGAKTTAADSANYLKAINEMRQHFKSVAFEWFNKGLFYKTTADSIKKRILADVAKVDTVIATKAVEDSGFDEVKQLKKLNKKLYLINSDVIPTDTAYMKAHKIPFMVKYINATGHYPMNEKPDDFNRALEGIIGDLKK